MGRPSLFIVASLLTALMAGVSCKFELPNIPGLPEIPELPPVETVIHPVPGYGVLNGTVESSVYNNRTFWGFRSVFYAEMPTPEMRFLVRTNSYNIQQRSFPKHGISSSCIYLTLFSNPRRYIYNIAAIARVGYLLHLKNK